MQDCRYSNDKTEDRIVHEICSNEEMKKINHSEKDIPCMRKSCGMFEKSNKQNSFNK